MFMMNIVLNELEPNMKDLKSLMAQIQRRDDITEEQKNLFEYYYTKLDLNLIHNLHEDIKSLIDEMNK
jgi:hypothetical protein